MNGALSQFVALCSAANGVIAGRLEPHDFYPSHSEFKFCNSVRFVTLKQGFLKTCLHKGKAPSETHEVERYASPNDWLASLKQNASRVWLVYRGTDATDAPDHQLAAFVGGGGAWQLVVATDSETEYWMSRWQVTKQNAPDNRIWGVTYGCVHTMAQSATVPRPRTDLAVSRLFRALNATRDFALQHNLQIWADLFQRAIDCIDGAACFPEYVDFVCLESYPDASQRLLAAAYNGWVFGGMGSWNDLGFAAESDNQRYHDLSAELYSAITDGIQQATWTFDPNKSA